MEQFRDRGKQGIREAGGSALIALLVVIVIIALLAAVAVPRYLDYLEDSSGEEESVLDEVDAGEIEGTTDVAQLDAIRTAAQSAAVAYGSVVKIDVEASGGTVTEVSFLVGTAEEGSGGTVEYSGTTYSTSDGSGPGQDFLTYMGVSGVSEIVFTSEEYAGGASWNSLDAEWEAE